MSHSAIISALFFVLACYVGLRVIYYLPLKRGWKWLLFLCLLIASESILIHRLAYKAGFLEAIPAWLSMGLNVAQAFCIILVLLSLAREVVLIFWFTFGRAFFKRKLRDPTEERRLWLSRMQKLSVGLCVLALLITGRGVYNALKMPGVVQVEITSPHIPAALDGFRIAQLSDLHVSSGSNTAWLQGIVERTNALNPDMIALTGDMLDGEAMQMQLELAPLNDLSAPYGVFVIEGNHEYYVSYGSWLEYMNKISKHRLLRNQGLVVDVNGAKLGVSGATDIQGRFVWTPPGLEEAFRPVSGAEYKILLWHRPKQAELAAEAGFDLMLSGHTHGGQFFPGNLLAAIPNKYVAGLYGVEGMALYVNPGSSLWGRLPLRLGVQSEITLLVLRSAAKPVE